MKAPLPWRVGTRVPEHIYDGDGKPLVTMPSAELAALVVAAVNAHDQLEAERDDWHKLADERARELCGFAPQLPKG